MDEEATDRYLGQLLRMSVPAADEPFVSRVARAVQAEERIRASQRAAWRRFGVETVIAAVVLVAFLLLARLAGEPEGTTLSMASPAAASVMLLGLWFATTLGGATEGAT
jgi:uncharacterized membrane protein